MNKPTIKQTRRKHKHKLIEQLIASDTDHHHEPIAEDKEIDLLPSGAVVNESVDLNEKALIPSSRRKHKRHRAKSHDSILFDEDNKEYVSGSDVTEDEDYVNISYYPSGAISTNVAKPTIHKPRRAKSHANVTKTDYDYDSIWSVQPDAMINDESFLIDTVMDKPCVLNKRKHKSHHVDINDLMST